MTHEDLRRICTAIIKSKNSFANDDIFEDDFSIIENAVTNYNLGLWTMDETVDDIYAFVAQSLCLPLNELDHYKFEVAKLESVTFMELDSEARYLKMCDTDAGNPIIEILVSHETGWQFFKHSDGSFSTFIEELKFHGTLEECNKFLNDNF